MSKRKKHYRSGKAIKAGLPPGSLVYSGEKQAAEPVISLLSYNVNEFDEQSGQSFQEVSDKLNDAGRIKWLNLNGVHDTEMVAHIGKHFKLHSLLLEDIVSVHQRPKTDRYDQSLYVVVRMLDFDETLDEIAHEQVSFILFKDTIISFQEKEGDQFDFIRERLRQNKGRIRSSEADYLLYTLLDTIVDHYFTILEKIGERMEGLEIELFDSPGENTIRKIHKLKREMIYLKKNIWPMRELINNLNKLENEYFKIETTYFLRDLYDHIIQVIDTTETFRDVLTGLQEMYLSSISNRTNTVMKVLTIIATIFIPLTFIVGIYGMNFEHMPELEWRYGYLFIWIFMIAVVGGMIWYFKRKQWL